MSKIKSVKAREILDSRGYPTIEVEVKTEEFIPKEYLPTFNSNVIEMNLHRIENLSEKFILFNDDLFILRKIKPIKKRRIDYAYILFVNILIDLKCPPT